MLKITKKDVTGDCSPKNPPVARCKSGETVVFETRNCYDDRLRPDGTVVDKESAIANPATGPLYVENALKGDVLKVEILDITLEKIGYMRASTSGGAFCDLVSERKVRAFDVSSGFVQFTDKLKLPIDTMIGVIGTAPEHDSVPTDTPREHGGNMDCNKIVKGSTLYLPVLADGALLSMGDLHALMGDGEVMICGLETGGEVTVRVSVVKNYKMPTPCLRCRGRFMSMQSAETLEQASKMASRDMLHFIMEQTSLDVYEAAMLLSLKGDLSICQIVDPLMTVRMQLDEPILEALGIKLP